METQLIIPNFFLAFWKKYETPLKLCFKAFRGSRPPWTPPPAPPCISLTGWAVFSSGCSRSLRLIDVSHTNPRAGTHSGSHGNLSRLQKTEKERKLKRERWTQWENITRKGADAAELCNPCVSHRGITKSPVSLAPPAPPRPAPLPPGGTLHQCRDFKNRARPN